MAWFKDFKQPDFARAGNRATRTVVLPAGPVMQHHSDPPEPFPHNEEPQLRKLGLATVMRRGVPTLTVAHTVCEAGKAVTPEQAQLLKLTGEKMVEFRVGLKARWDADSGDVVEIDEPELRVEAEEEGEGEEDEEEPEDEI
jgi:mRNA turnover protein 4